MLRIFSAMRPSGKLHLGNYLGALKNWIDLQDKPDTERSIFSIVDYHGITTPFDPKIYHRQVMDVALDFLAAGVDPKKALLVRQSKISEHTELAWIFNTITPVSWLNRLPTYQEKLEKSPKYNNMGLLDYPVLMAADILVYKSNFVPVGEDQMPHIDLTNEIVKKFNSMFGETFETVKVPKIEGARIMSLQDPTKKMSKTHSAPRGYYFGNTQHTQHKSGQAGSGQTGDSFIALMDKPDVVRAKIKKAVTDSGKEIKYDLKNRDKAAITNLIIIHSLLSGQSIGDIEKEYEGKTYVEFKDGLAEVIVDFLRPFQEKRKEFENNLDEVENLLTESEQNAKKIAVRTLTEVKEKMGL